MLGKNIAILAHFIFVTLIHYQNINQCQKFRKIYFDINKIVHRQV